MPTAPRWDPRHGGDVENAVRPWNLVLRPRGLEGGRRPCEDHGRCHTTPRSARCATSTMRCCGSCSGARPSRPSRRRSTAIAGRYGALTSPVAQEVLARWHAESHRLTVDHPIRALISYYGGRGQLRLPEGSPARQRQLRAAAQGRAALARKRAAGAVPLPDALPAPPEPSSAKAMEPLTVAPNTDQQQVAKALRTIEAMRERDAQEQRARRESCGPAPMMRPRTAVVLPHNRPAERTVRAVDPGDDSQTRLLRSCTPST
jgi:hypothetical protein